MFRKKAVLTIIIVLFFISLFPLSVEAREWWERPVRPKPEDFRDSTSFLDALKVYDEDMKAWLEFESALSPAGRFQMPSTPPFRVGIEDYKYDFLKTTTSLRYIGDFMHDKTVNFFGGDARFILEGLGEVGGTHRVISSVHEDLWRNQELKTHIHVHFFGTTDDTFVDMMALEQDTLAFIASQRMAAVNALNQGILDANTSAASKANILNQMEQDTINFLESQRRSAINDLNRRIMGSTTVTGGNYYSQLNQMNTYYDMAIAAVKDGHALSRQSAIAGADESTENILNELESLNEYYDNLHRSVIESFDAFREKNVSIASSINLKEGAELFVGIRMNPGESGYIKQGVYTYEEKMYDDTQEGDFFLKIDNRIKNTGGQTRRDLKIDGYIDDKMKVDGYAEVWETTTLKRGNSKTGWWDPNF